MTGKSLRNRSARQIRLIRLHCSWAALRVWQPFCSGCTNILFKSSWEREVRVHPPVPFQKLREESHVCRDDHGTQGAHTGSSLPTANREREAVKQEKAYTNREKPSYVHRVSCQRATVPLGSDRSVLPWLKSLPRKAWKIIFLFGWARQKRTVGKEVRKLNSLKRLLSRREAKWTIHQRKKRVFERKRSKIQLYLIH